MVNRRRVQRLYRAAGLLVQQRRRKRVAVARQPLAAPRGPGERWSMDLVRDTLGGGRVFRAFTLVDDCTRECLAIQGTFALPSARAARVCAARGQPNRIVFDNGPEFAGRVLDQWEHTRGLTLVFIQLGRPAQNGYVESFNGRRRDECLNESWFVRLADAQATIEAWRQDYNEVRAHRWLAGRSPA